MTLLTPEQALAERFVERANARLDFDEAVRQHHIPILLETDDQLHEWVLSHLGIYVPRKAVCTGHTAPFTAFADAYFARSPRCVWKASRGFGGKTVMLAALSLTEAITLGAGVSLLGGSAEQSQRVHAYMAGEDTNLPYTFWEHPNAPRRWLTALNVRNTRLTNGGWLRALAASPKSVRGPHPQRLRGDEIDEMDSAIWDAAQGQPMEARGIREQVVGSSTHQHSDGTMSREIAQAAEKGWPFYEWCYRETMADGGFINEAQVERKKATVTVQMWDTEYEGQEPNPEERAITTDAVNFMFQRERGVYDGRAAREPLIFEQPIWEMDPDWAAADAERREAIRYKMVASYAAGADWGKKRDHTVAWVLRTDVDPVRVVAYMNMVRLPYPQMFAAFNALLQRYDADAAHDATGLGTVADDYVEDETEGVSLVGARRANTFSEAIVGIEGKQVVAPFIEYAYTEFKYCSNGDLYQTSANSKNHPPDSFVGFALAYRAATRSREIFV